MNMLSEDTSNCLYCNPHKWVPGKPELACVFHLRRIAQAMTCEEEAQTLLKRAWNVDSSREDLASLMKKAGTTPDPAVPPLEVTDPGGAEIFPRESRKELDDASGA